jgi:hypothetical protein
MMSAHITSIIEDKLSISYEEEDAWVSDVEPYTEEIAPAEAVLLVTRCCKVNHDHIALTHAQAAVLAQWLDDFVKGAYDEAPRKCGCKLYGETGVHDVLCDSRGNNDG